MHNQLQNLLAVLCHKRPRWKLERNFGTYLILITLQLATSRLIFRHIIFISSNIRDIIRYHSWKNGSGYYRGELVQDHNILFWGFVFSTVVFDPLLFAALSAVITLGCCYSRLLLLFRCDSLRLVLILGWCVPKVSAFSSSEVCLSSLLSMWWLLNQTLQFIVTLLWLV